MNLPIVSLSPYSTSAKRRGKVFKSKTQKRDVFIPENGKTIQEIRTYVLEQQQILAVALREKNISAANKQIRKMVRSQDFRILAVYNTISKRGYRSPGLSSTTPTTNKDYSELVASLWKIVKNPANYKATPLLRTLIPKPKGGFRPISVPTYLDRCIQHLYKLVLEVVAEEIQSPYSFGFRPFRSPGWASKCLILATHPLKLPPTFALELDFEKCFDAMCHKWMLDHLCSISIGDGLGLVDVIPPNILEQWLKCGFILVADKDDPKASPFPTTGIPQGGPISPTLANLVLHGVEDVILQIAKENNTYVFPARFADDITLLFSEPALYQQILDGVDKFMAPRGLNLNRNKCFLRKLTENEPFNFVGFSHHVVLKRKPNYINDAGKVVVTKKYSVFNVPLPNKITAVKKKIYRLFRDPNKSPEAIFRLINPILRGWLNFYCCANSSLTFKHLAWWLWHQVFYFFWRKYKVLREFRRGSRNKRHLLGNFIVKTHTKRHGKSLRDHKTPRNLQWWYIPKDDTVKKEQNYFLVDPELTPIIQPKIIYLNPDPSLRELRKGLNAFHPQDRLYLQTKALNWRFGTWSKALEKTGGTCAYCGCSLVSFTEEEIIDLHHIQPIKFGGPRSIPNLLPLCKECHKDVTKAQNSRDLETIEKYEALGILKGVSSALKLLKK